ncbi:MAG: tRNA lysidine(34) synthetase TilS, partial [Bacteroidaceae bacterium]
MAEIKEKVGRFIAAKNLFSNSDRLLVGLSGGADSVCLQTVLHELGYKIGAAHCNFHLRGSESDRDEAFVRNLCGQMGIPLHVAQFQTADYAKEHGLSIEMAARELRYGFFQEIMASQGYTKTAIAHHSDDNIE